MQEAEAEEPEKDGMVDYVAVDQAQKQLAIAEGGNGGGGVVVAVDEGQAVEDEHNGGGEAIVALNKHGHAEEGPRHGRHKEVDEAAAHGLVESKGVSHAHGSDIRAYADGEEGDDDKHGSHPYGHEGVGRGVERELLGPLRQPGVGFVTAQQQPCTQRDDAGIETNDDDGPSADGLKSRRAGHKVLYLAEGIDGVFFVHNFKSALRCKVTMLFLIGKKKFDF